MAAKCKNEQKALKKAEQTTLKAEGRKNHWETIVEQQEAAAQYTLGSAISGCTDSEGRLDEKCVIDEWIHAHHLLEDLLGYREHLDFYEGLWDLASIEELRLKEEYHKCLDRERSR